MMNVSTQIPGTKMLLQLCGVKMRYHPRELVTYWTSMLKTLIVYEPSQAIQTPQFLLNRDPTCKVCIDDGDKGRPAEQGLRLINLKLNL
jgi:hypothetical protein